MNVSVKTKIRYKGQEYASPDQLPNEARSAYEAAMSGTSAATPKATVTKNIMLNGQEFSSENEMPVAERRLYDDAMQLMRDSPAATPSPAAPAARLTKEQLLILLVGFFVLAAFIIALKSGN